MILYLFKFFPKPVDCKWGEWNTGTCSKTCGLGNRRSSRTKAVLKAHGGKECAGNTWKDETCNLRTCPGKGMW